MPEDKDPSVVLDLRAAQEADRQALLARGRQIMADVRAQLAALDDQLADDVENPPV